MIDLLKNILRFFRDALSWLIDFVEWCVTKIFLLIFDAVVAVLSLIPVPEWLADLSGNITAIDPGILFFVRPFELGTGLTWVVSAYVIRFLIRRIPVVG